MKNNKQLFRQTRRLEPKVKKDLKDKSYKSSSEQESQNETGDIETKYIKIIHTETANMESSNAETDNMETENIKADNPNPEGSESSDARKLLREERRISKKRRKNILITCFIGLALLLVVFGYSIQYAEKQAHQQLNRTIRYVKTQCANYIQFNEASVAKSLMYIIGEDRQIDRNLKYDKKIDSVNPDEEDLSVYVKERRLSGIILLDEHGNVECEYNTDGIGADGLREHLMRENVLDVSCYPEKIYANRVTCEDGSHIDLAACGRTDNNGIVVVYTHTETEYAKNYTLTLQSLLSGYETVNDGTIVVTNGTDIVASNDKTLLSDDMDETMEGREILYQLRQHGHLKEMIRVKNNIRTYYGSMDKGRQYYIYMYMPMNSVFHNVPRNVLAVLVAYILMVIVIQMLTYREEQRFLLIQRMQEQNMQEQLKEAAKKAESANVAKTEFLQRMSHDIRTPINGICGMVEVAEHYKDNVEKQAECRRKIKEASHLLLELINEVLDMGKLESGEVVLEERSFCLNEILDELQTVIEKQAAERGIQIIRKEYQISHMHLIGSPRHVKRMLMNIMSNAVKYNKENGTIWLGCRELPASEFLENVCVPEAEQDCFVLDNVLKDIQNYTKDSEKNRQEQMVRRIWIEFTCTDTGIGMSKEFLAHLFEPFTQEENGARSAYGGSGLGMSITKSLIEKMGGTIHVESEQGEGTTYIVCVPFVIDTSEKTVMQETDKLEQVSIENVTILLAEDNELNQEIACFVLETAGAKVIKAVNGQEAVDMFSDSRPGEIDVILMDVMMPVMDGLEATRTIRNLSRPDASKIPILAMTANAFTEDILTVKRAGMNDHLAKPLDTTLVIQTIARYVK